MQVLKKDLGHSGSRRSHLRFGDMELLVRTYALHNTVRSGIGDLMV